MHLFIAKVRVDGHNIVEAQVIAESVVDAKEQLEMQYGEGNVVYYPRLVA